MVAEAKGRVQNLSSEQVAAEIDGGGSTPLERLQDEPPVVAVLPDAPQKALLDRCAEQPVVRRGVSMTDFVMQKDLSG